MAGDGLAVVDATRGRVVERSNQVFSADYSIKAKI